MMQQEKPLKILLFQIFPQGYRSTNIRPLPQFKFMDSFKNKLKEKSKYHLDSQVIMQKQSKQFFFEKLFTKFQDGKVKAVIIYYCGGSQKPEEQIDRQNTSPLILNSSSKKEDGLNFDDIINKLQPYFLKEQFSTLLILDTEYSEKWIKQLQDKIEKKPKNQFFNKITIMSSSLSNQEAKNYQGSQYASIISQFNEFNQYQQQYKNLNQKQKKTKILLATKSFTCLVNICDKISKLINHRTKQEEQQEKKQEQKTSFFDTIKIMFMPQKKHIQKKQVYKRTPQISMGYIKDDFFFKEIPIFVHSYGQILDNLKPFYDLYFQNQQNMKNNINQLKKLEQTFDKIERIKLLQIKENEYGDFYPVWKLYNGRIFHGVLYIDATKQRNGQQLLTYLMQRGTITDNHVNTWINVKAKQMKHNYVFQIYKKGYSYNYHLKEQQKLVQLFEKKAYTRKFSSQCNSSKKIKQPKKTSYRTQIDINQQLTWKKYQYHQKLKQNNGGYYYFTWQKFQQLIDKNNQISKRNMFKNTILQRAKELLDKYAFLTISEYLDIVCNKKPQQSFKKFKYLERWSALQIQIIPYILKVNEKQIKMSLTFCIHLQSQGFYHFKTIVIGQQKFNYKDQRHILIKKNIKQLLDLRIKKNTFIFYDINQKQAYILKVQDDIQKVFSSDEKINYLLGNQRNYFELQDHNEEKTKQISYKQKIKAIAERFQLKLLRELVSYYRQVDREPFLIYDLQYLSKLLIGLKGQYITKLLINIQKQKINDQDINQFDRQLTDLFKNLKLKQDKMLKFQQKEQCSYIKNKRIDIINRTLKKERINDPEFIIHNQFKFQKIIFDKKYFEFEWSNKKHKLWLVAGMQLQQETSDKWFLKSVWYVYCDSVSNLYYDGKTIKPFLKHFDEPDRVQKSHILVQQIKPQQKHQKIILPYLNQQSNDQTNVKEEEVIFIKMIINFTERQSDISFIILNPNKSIRIIKAKNEKDYFNKINIQIVTKCWGEPYQTIKIFKNMNNILSKTIVNDEYHIHFINSCIQQKENYKLLDIICVDVQYNSNEGEFNVGPQILQLKVGVAKLNLKNIQKQHKKVIQNIKIIRFKLQIRNQYNQQNLSSPIQNLIKEIQQQFVKIIYKKKKNLKKTTIIKQKKGVKFESLQEYNFKFQGKEGVPFQVFQVIQQGETQIDLNKSNDQIIENPFREDNSEQENPFDEDNTEQDFNN